MPRPTKRDPIELHPVMLALSKARAAMTLADICAHGSDYLQMPKTAITPHDEQEIRGWIQDFAFDALRAAIAEAGDAFRGAITPDQVHEQVISSTKAVA